MIFSVENGQFGYADRKILHGVSFSLESSEVMTVLGPNGVGKTTLLKCMMGLLNWETGKTLIDGKPMKEM